MPSVTESPYTSLFDQAFQTYGETLKAAVKGQEQVANYWTDVLSKAGANSDFQKKSRAFFNDAIPAAQKNAEEWVRMLEQNYRRSIDLLKKACEPANAAVAGDFQAKLQGLWEQSVELIKENTQAMTQAHLKVLELWADVLRHNGVAIPGVPGAPSSAPKGSVRQG
jgi:hypothetical protein